MSSKKTNPLSNPTVHPVKAKTYPDQSVRKGTGVENSAGTIGKVNNQPSQSEEQKDEQTSSARRVASIREVSSTNWEHRPKPQNSALSQHSFDSLNVISAMAQQMLSMSEKLQYIENTLNQLHQPEATALSASPAPVQVELTPQTVTADIIFSQNVGEENSNISLAELQTMWDNALEKDPGLKDSAEYANFQYLQFTHDDLSRAMGVESAEPSLLPAHHLSSLNFDVSLATIGKMLQGCIQQGVMQNTPTDATYALDKIYEVSNNFGLSENTLASSITLNLPSLPKHMQTAQGFDHLLAKQAASEITGKAIANDFSHNELTYEKARQMGFITKKETAVNDALWTAKEQAGYIRKMIDEITGAAHLLESVAKAEPQDRAGKLEELRYKVMTANPDVTALVGKADGEEYFAYLLALSEVVSAQTASALAQESSPSGHGLVSTNYINWKESLLNNVPASSLLPISSDPLAKYIPASTEERISYSVLPPPERKSASQQQVNGSPNKAGNPDIPPILAAELEQVVSLLQNTAENPEQKVLLENLRDLITKGGRGKLPVTAGDYATPFVINPATSPAFFSQGSFLPTSQNNRSFSTDSQSVSIENAAETLSTLLESSYHTIAANIEETIASNSYDLETLWDEIWRRVNRQMVIEANRY